MDKLSILTRASVSESDPEPVSATDKVMGVAKGEEETANNIPPSESEIKESLSEGDREVISVWRSVEGFSLSEAAARQLVASLRTEFIDVDILRESRAWAVRKLSELMDKNSLFVGRGVGKLSLCVKQKMPT